ncbi:MULTISPECIES: tetratricopeptide repeat-containing sensor histidine kinase [unclassified Myroides]|uniref:tetratricopeptide repeat-containing sensor histidine kinase n=1 Tax=unclassified Myroides TaxID=2642485 RepID=UPI003D2F978D
MNVSIKSCVTCFLLVVLLSPSSVRASLVSSPSAVDSIVFRYTTDPAAMTSDAFSSLIDLSYDYSDQMQFDDCNKLLTFLFTFAQDNQSRKGTLYHVHGYNHARQRKNRQATEDYLKSAELRRKTGEDLVLNYTLSNLGKVFYDMGDYVQAINAYKEALEAAHRINDKTCIALALNGIGIVLSDQKKYEEALEYFSEATVNYTLAKDSAGMGRNYFDIGEIKYLLKQPAAALDYFDLALEIGQQVGDELLVSYSQHRIGTIYFDQQQYKEAEEYFIQGLEVREKASYPLEMALSHLDLARLYQATQHFDKAIMHAFKARELAQQTDFLKGQYLAVELLADLYEIQQQYQQALVFQKERKQLNDSLFSVDKNQKIEDFNTEIRIEKETNALKLSYIKQKNNLFLLSFALSGIALALTIYFLRLKARNKRKFEYQIKQLETEAEKQTILGVYEERKRIARDVHDDLGSSISGIKMLSELIFDQTTDPNLKQSHAKLLLMQTEVTEKVRDIIWMLNYENNTLDKLAWYCKSYTGKILENFPIKIKTRTEGTIPVVKINDDIRKSFFLCLKEALNNILKHAKASQVELIFRYEQSSFSIEVRDNGKGLDKNAMKGFKNGMENMKNRMQSIEGRFEIQSNAQGTCVIFSKDIPQKGD